jgi:DNA end-binding protein Ku
MPKAFWKGAISFGMVNIPVKMYLATISKTPNFPLLHKKCLTRPKQVLFCQEDNEYFNSKETVRGYEYTKGEYVVLSDSDFEKVPVRTTHIIDIQAFVGTEEIDPIYFEGAHYLEPEDLSAKPFCLLRDALRKSGKVGLAKVAFQRREHLGCIRPFDSILVMHTMHYQDEIVPRSDITVPEKEFSKDELKMAESLIDIMVKKYQPADFKDEYQRALEEIIKAKLAGKEIKITELPKYEEIPDLMAALKASIEAATKETATRPGGPSNSSAKKRRV